MRNISDCLKSSGLQILSFPRRRESRLNSYTEFAALDSRLRGNDNNWELFKRFLILLFFPFFLLGSPYARAENSAKSSFEQISDCVQKGDIDGCHGLLTASSEPLYTSFVDYDLVSCLPKNIGYISQKKSGNHVIIRSSVSVGDNTRYTRLAFVEEEGQWKLDVPESLRIGMGENWQQQIDATEQIYLMLRKQMGNQLNCGMIENLAMINKKK